MFYSASSGQARWLNSCAGKCFYQPLHLRIIGSSFRPFNRVRFVINEVHPFLGVLT